MREEFERLPEIAERLKHVWWSEDGGQYCDTGKHPNSNGAFLNGALYAFQEQQKKIGEALKHLNDVRNKGMDQSVYFAIKELLK